MSNLVHRFVTGNKVVFWTVLVSALVIIGARALAPFEVGKDQATQLEAAQRLAHGQGLTTTSDVEAASYDIMVNSNPQYLTWWPPGFSLIIAACLKLGLSLFVSLKIIYSVVSLVGWIGWALLVSQFIALPFRIGEREYPIHLVIAVLLPVFFTPRWDGTDIFLWAAIPFIFLGLFRHGGARNPISSVVTSGILFGAVYAVRFASLFLALAAFMILVQVRFPNYKAALKSFAIFLASSSIIILPTYLYGKAYAASDSSITNRTSEVLASPNFLQPLKGAIFKLPVISNLIFGFSSVEEVIIAIGSRPLMIVSGVIFLVILFSLPLVLIRLCKKSGRPLQSDMALSLSFLPISLVVFLLSVNLIVNLGLFGVGRYYEPIAWCGLLVFYQLATMRLIKGLPNLLSRTVVLVFVAYICLYMPSLIFVPERNGHIVKTVLGYVPSNNEKYRGTSYKVGYPSFTVFSNKESSRQKIRELSQSDPKALFFVEEYGSFIYDGFEAGGPVPGQTLRVLPRIDYWKRAHTSAQVKVFWVLNDKTNLGFVPSNNLRVVFSDPVERTKILVSDFTAGQIFTESQTAAVGSPIRQ